MYVGGVAASAGAAPGPAGPPGAFSAGGGARSFASIRDALHCPADRNGPRHSARRGADAAATSVKCAMGILTVRAVGCTGSVGLSGSGGGRVRPAEQLRHTVRVASNPKESRFAEVLVGSQGLSPPLLTSIHPPGAERV